jgi:hypothetical protein
MGNCVKIPDLSNTELRAAQQRHWRYSTGGAAAGVPCPDGGGCVPTAARHRRRRRSSDGSFQAAEVAPWKKRLHARGISGAGVCDDTR